MDNIIKTLELLNTLAIPLFFTTLIVLIILLYRKNFRTDKTQSLFSQVLKRAQHSSFLDYKKADEFHGISFGLDKHNQVVFSREDTEQHIGVFSSTGTGKTSSVVIPSIRSLQHSTSFIIDVSGDICKNCQQTPNKLVFEPENPNSNVKFNIFAAIDILPEHERPEGLMMLAHLILPEPTNINSSPNAKFFFENGRRILIASLLCFYDLGMDFPDIAEKVMKSSYQELFKEIDQSNNSLAIMYINGFQGTSEQNISGCKGVCNEALELYCTNEKIRTSIGRPSDEEISLEPLKLETNNIFIVVSEDRLSLYAPLLNIITSQFMQYISTRTVYAESPTIQLILDEFPALRINPSLILDGVRRFRKRKARILLLMQNIVDLDVLYDKDVSRAILSNLHYKLLLGGLGDPTSQTYFAEIIGKKTIKKYSISHSAGTTTKTQTEERTWAIEPAELDRQGKDTAILIGSDLPQGYLKLKKNYYFK